MALQLQRWFSVFTTTFSPMAETLNSLLSMVLQLQMQEQLIYLTVKEVHQVPFWISTL